MSLSNVPTDMGILLSAESPGLTSPTHSLISYTIDQDAQSFSSYMSFDNESQTNLSLTNLSDRAEDITNTLAMEDILSSDFMDDLQMALVMASSSDLFIDSDYQELSVDELENSSDDEDNETINVQQLQPIMQQLNSTSEKISLNFNDVMSERELLPIEFVPILVDELHADFEVNSSNLTPTLNHNNFKLRTSAGGFDLINDNQNTDMDTEMMDINDDALLDSIADWSSTPDISLHISTEPNVSNSLAEQDLQPEILTVHKNNTSLLYYASSVTITKDESSTIQVLNTNIDVPVDDKNWHKSMADLIVKQMYPQNIQSASIKLNPEELGPIYIDFKLDESVANINFTAANIETKMLLEQNFTLLAKQITDETNLTHANLNFSGGQQHNDGSSSGQAGGQSGRTFFNNTATTTNSKQLSAMTSNVSKHDGKIDIKI